LVFKCTILESGRQKTKSGRCISFPDSENRAISLVLWVFAQCKSSCGFVQVLSALTGYDRSHKKEKNFQRMEI